MNNVLIIFGATGDLMDKKISPALFGLNREKPGAFHKVIGFGRRDLTDDEFKKMVTESIAKKSKFNQEDLNKFLEKIEYHKGEFHDIESFKSLNQKIADKYFEVSKNIYLAIPSEQFNDVITNLGESGFIDTNTKLMVEKPIGKDLESSRVIEALFAKYFKENQIYRIDHYLGKDSLQNVLSFRFANSMFDPVWSNQFVEKIEINLNEELGVENRGSFYDSLGALRDVGQNHLLQMLVLTTMAKPDTLSSENIRKNRFQILDMLHIMNEDEVKANTYRAQYSGYKEIKDVKPDSETETFFKIKCALNDERWNGVPIYLQSGKRLTKVNKDIVVYFKGINKVIFSLEPEDSIKIYVKTKKPGITFENEDNMITLKMKEIDASHEYIAEYSQLFHDFLNGDQTFFISKDESEAMWKFIQPIIDAWNKNLVELETYEVDSDEAIIKAKEKIGD